MIKYDLKFKVSEISKILEVDKKIVKDWTYHFADFLTPKANPRNGDERKFTLKDLCTLSYISYYWETNPDFENIKYGLNRGDQFEYPFSEIGKEITPIFREYSDEVLTKNTWMVGGMISGADILFLANSYKKAGDILINKCIKEEHNNKFIYPAIYNYRHSTELYLKSVITNHNKTHKLLNLYSNFKILITEKFGEKIPSWFENIIIAFDEFDSNGTSFRYGDNEYKDELFIDLIHIKEMMDWFSESINRINNEL